MANEKKVEVKVMTGVEDSQVDGLEKKITHLKQQKLQAKLEADASELEKVNSRITQVKKELANLKGDVNIDDGKVKALESELKSLENKSLSLELSVEKGKLDAAKAEIEEMDGMEINVDANMSMQNISQGIAQAKQGISELKQSMDEVAAAGMQTEQNKAFLTMNLGADKAKQTYQDISDIVASMPGDDNTMRSVLSTAQALGNNLNASEMKSAAGTMADYMSASATMGKMAKESEQDIMKYLLDGNTAELERGSIVSSRVDKLKEATTFMERQKAMQEVLNELGYGGISQQDTMLNKQAEWEGMIYNSQDALSSMWLGAEKGAMDYILKLNDSTNGLVGMGIVAAEMAGGPLIDTVSGLGQIAVGMKALKDLEMIKWLKDLEIMTKLSAAADYLLAGAQAVLNFVMSMNPIILVVLALVALIAALVWAYYNVDWFREMVDNAWASLVQFAQYIYGIVAGAIQWLGDLFNQFTSQIGLNTNDWIQAILGFILFIPQLPLQLAVALANAIAKTLGFGNNFVQTITNSAVRSVTNFMQWISSLPGRLQAELNRMLSAVGEWAATLPQKFWDAGVNAVKNFLNALGIHSPGYMYWNLYGELGRLEDLPEDMEGDITGNISRLGSNISSAFNPNLNAGNASLSEGGTGMPNQTFIININDPVVDNDERMQRIVDHISKAISWDNTTAGRTV